MNTITVADTRIRRDSHRRYCLNDLHKAAVVAGANARTKEPAAFLRSARTQELLALLSQESATQNLRSTFEPVNAVENGPYDERGTYVCIELVIAYGQFVSAAFDLKVIRIFLAVQHQEHAMPHIQSTKFWDALRPHWSAIADLALVGCKNKEIAETLGRSVGSVGRCLRRMFDVGYLNPVAVFTARLKPATAQRWAITKPVAAQWGRSAYEASASTVQMNLAL